MLFGFSRFFGLGFGLHQRGLFFVATVGVVDDFLVLSWRLEVI